MEASLSQFFGRFHPLIVHLPIGFIVLTLIFDYLGFWKKKAPFAWMVCSIASIVTAFSGWLLAGSPGYPQDIIWWHKWLGIGLCFLCLFLWFSKKNQTTNKWINTILYASIVIVLIVGGHLGGNLTHGENYLIKKAPKFIQKLAGYSNQDTKIDLSSIHLDSIQTFPHLIQPIFESKCIKCHGNSSPAGALDMSSIEGLKKGGLSGASFVAGNALESELFKRVALSQEKKKFMPIKGIPLTFGETEILKWWICSLPIHQTTLKLNNKYNTKY